MLDLINLCFMINFAETCLDKPDMPVVRIIYRDTRLDEQKVIEKTDFIVPLVGHPKAFYTDRKKELRILCGLIKL